MAQPPPVPDIEPLTHHAEDEAAIKRIFVEFAKAEVARLARQDSQHCFSERRADGNYEFELRYSQPTGANSLVHRPLIRTRLPPACHRGLRATQVDCVLQGRAIIIWNPEPPTCTCGNRLQAHGRQLLKAVCF